MSPGEPRAMRWRTGPWLCAHHNHLAHPGDAGRRRRPVHAPAAIYCGVAGLKRLTELTSDAPRSLQHATPSCASLAEANRTRLAHKGDNYSPRYAGRLIHMDIAGPFQAYLDSGRRYALIIVGDHTRFKAVHTLRHLHEAALRVRRFLASFTALLNAGRNTPTRVVGTIHIIPGARRGARHY
eukprot:208646-Pleurochrysis_carterae.AAC.3